MKKILIPIFLLFTFLNSFSQKIYVEAYDENYVSNYIDNKFFIRFEKIDPASIIIEVKNGRIKKVENYYIINFDSMQSYSGRIDFYKKIKNKKIFYGSKIYDFYNLPSPIFKIESGEDSVSLESFKAQEWVRAEINNTNFKYNQKYLNAEVVQFSAKIFLTDSCKTIDIINIGNKISDTLKQTFALLSSKDFVIFHNIFVNYEVLNARPFRIKNQIYSFRQKSLNSSPLPQ